jgi:hypothetical protein
MATAASGSNSTSEGTSSATGDSGVGGSSSAASGSGGSGNGDVMCQHKYNGSCYAIFAETINWDTAKENCASVSGRYLATLSDMLEYNEVLGWLKGITPLEPPPAPDQVVAFHSGPWIGGRRPDNDSSFSWVNSGGWSLPACDWPNSDPCPWGIMKYDGNTDTATLLTIYEPDQDRHCIFYGLWNIDWDKKLMHWSDIDNVYTIDPKPGLAVGSCDNHAKSYVCEWPAQ